MIVVTGAAGFIGSALAWELNRRGRTDLLLVDSLGRSDKWRNLVALNYLDYMEKDAFLELVEGDRLDPSPVEAVFHLGACSSTTEGDASYLAKNNFEYTKRLASWCLDNTIRFVYASSAATYGDGSQGYLDDHAGLESLRPLNMYGYSKHLFDLWAKHQGCLDQVVGLKYFNVYGPNEYHKGDMRSMVMKAYEQIQARGTVQLFRSHRPAYRDGEQLRDFIYVKDAVAMTLHFLDTSVPGGLYNVGTGKARSWKDMMLAIFSGLEREPSIEFVDMPEALQGKYQYFTQAEMSKIQATGWTSPSLSLEAGVQDYLHYLKSGPLPLGY